MNKPLNLKPFLKRFTALCALGLGAVALVSCSAQKPTDPLIEDFGAGANLVAPIIGTTGDRIGIATLTEGPSGVILKIDIAGLAPGWHGIHLHQIGDCSDGNAGFKASKSHIDPANHAHGLLNPEGFEAGDMPNLYVGNDGRATAAFYLEGLGGTPSEEAYAMFGGKRLLLDDDGTAMVIHEKQDDHKTQPIGGAGARVACAAFVGQ